MAIRSVSIQGFRSVRNISLPLSQLNIISGPNGSGKSNLYKAVRLLHEAASGRLSAAIAEEGGMQKVMWAGGQRYGSSQSGYSQQYQDPFSGAGFGFGPFGFGYYSTSGSSGRQSYGSAAGDPELRAAANYIRSGFYEEAMNTLNGIPTANRTAQWHYYAALANQGLGNNIRAQEEARTAVSMEDRKSVV